MEIFALPVNFELTTRKLRKSNETNEKEEKYIVEGYASTYNNVDRQNEVISEEALIKAEKDLLENNTVFYEHKHDELPVGKVIEASVDSKGLKIKVQISKTADKIWQLIKEGILNRFSIGGRVIKAVEKYNEALKRKVTEIQEIELLEVSVVGIPANPEARAVAWYISKALKGGKEMSEVEKKEEVIPTEKTEEVKVKEVKVEEVKTITEPVKEEIIEKKEEPKVEEKVEAPKIEEVKMEEKKVEEKKEEIVEQVEVKPPEAQVLPDLCPVCGTLMVDGVCPKCVVGEKKEPCEELPKKEEKKEVKEEDKPKEEKAENYYYYYEDYGEEYKEKTEKVDNSKLEADVAELKTVVTQLADRMATLVELLTKLATPPVEEVVAVPITPVEEACKPKEEEEVKMAEEVKVEKTAEPIVEKVAEVKVEKPEEKKVEEIKEEEIKVERKAILMESPYDKKVEVREVTQEEKDQVWKKMIWKKR